jgi:hypothetical protein
MNSLCRVSLVSVLVWLLKQQFLYFLCFLYSMKEIKSLNLKPQLGKDISVLVFCSVTNSRHEEKSFQVKFRPSVQTCYQKLNDHYGIFVSKKYVDAACSEIYLTGICAIIFIIITRASLYIPYNALTVYFIFSEMTKICLVL